MFALWLSMAFHLNNLGNLLKELDKLDEALDSYKDARLMPANETVMHPRYFNKGEIQKNRGKFKQILVDWYRNNPVIYNRKFDGSYDKQIIQGEDKLDKYADDIIEKILNDNDELGFDSAYFGMGKSKHLTHRTIDIPNKLVFDFIQQNPVQVMAAYIGRTASAYEFNQKFGGRSYDDLVDQIRDVSFNTAAAQAPRYSFVVLKPFASSHSLAALYLNSGLSPRVNKASKQP